MIATKVFSKKIPMIKTKGKKQLRGGKEMNVLLIINWILFLAVVAYALGLFTYLVKTRYQFIKMGKKVEFDNDVKARFQKI